VEFIIDESFVDSQKTLFVQMKTDKVSNGISCFCRAFKEW